MNDEKIIALLEQLIAETQQNRVLLERLAAGQPQGWGQPAPVDRFRQLPYGITDAVHQLVIADKLIQAIKVYRQNTGMGLAEAKEAVERYRDSIV